MSLGSLTLRVHLDHPQQLHCGDEPVTGRVIVGWLPATPTEPELFGPLKVILSFHGRAKTKLWKSNGQNTTIYRGRVPLFAFKTTVHDGPTRIARGETKSFRFRLKFPQCAQQGRSTLAVFNKDARYNVDPEQPLPPSFTIDYRGFAHHFEAFTAYRVGASASMAHIDVKSGSIDEDAEPLIKYASPRMPLSTMENILRKQQEHRRTIMLQNENLVPESERASGFKQKTKAFFKSDYYPQYNFTVAIKGPKSIYLEQAMVFEVRVTPDANPAQGVVIPDIELGLWSAKIEANTQVRAERTVFSCPESEGNETVVRFAGRMKDQGPFSKVNDWTRNLVTDRVTTVPISFTTFNIKRIYSLKVEFQILAAGKSFKNDYSWPLTIYPPLAQDTSPGEASMAEYEPAAVAGSSAPPPEESLDVPPPAYKKAAETVSLNAT